MPCDSNYLARFKADVISLPPSEVFGRYILPDPCMGATNIDQRSLRGRIASNFEIELKDVIIVGSAKLGFTLRRKRKLGDEEERPVFSPFSENSDIDIAIVSDALFDKIWKLCFEFWHGSGYAAASGYWPRGKYFRDYIFRGWMRPDHLPSEGKFTYKENWFDFFRELTSSRAAGDYRITAALYREQFFLKSYQEIAINECKAKMSADP
jgi:hypothetical protein